MKYIGGQGNHPRTAIYTLKAIKSRYMGSLNHRDLTAIVVKINSRETLVPSVYLDSILIIIAYPLLVANVIAGVSHGCTTFATNRGYAIIISMDSNCHSEIYSLETNKRGEYLEDFTGQYNLKVESQEKIPTFQAVIVSSIIDATLTARISVMVNNCRVSTSPIFLDHNTIKYELII